MAKARLDLRFDPDLLERIHEARGEESLTSWLEDAARGKLGDKRTRTLLAATREGRRTALTHRPNCKCPVCTSGRGGK